MNQFTIECMAIIEAIVNKENFGADESIKYIIENFSISNLVTAIKNINKELKRNNLFFDSEYIKAYDRLKNILKNVELIHNEIIIKNNIKNYFSEYNLLSICNTLVSSELKINLTFDSNNNYYITLNKLIDSKILILKDRYGNYYKFIYCTNNKYKLHSCYSLDNYSRLLLKNIIYISPFGNRIYDYK